MNIGVEINGKSAKSKKAVKEAFATDPDSVTAYRTDSMWGGPWHGRIAQLPDGDHHFVGPDPYTNRKFYGTISIRDQKVTTIK